MRSITKSTDTSKKYQMHSEAPEGGSKCRRLTHFLTKDPEKVECKKCQALDKEGDKVVATRLHGHRP
jgi:hypothetical protein